MIARFLCLSSMLAAIFVASVSPARDETPKAPPPRIKRLSGAEIERLIDRLGSADYRERESATEMLKQRSEAAIALLRANRTTDSPEVKRRLESILPTMMTQEVAEKRLARLPAYVKDRQLDRLVETMVACREFITIEHDAQVRAFVKDIYTAATKGNNFPPTPWLPPTVGEFADFKTFAWQNRLGLSNTPTIVARTAPSLKGLGTGIIASDTIVGSGQLFHCIALCNGNINIHSLSNSILITTGSVRLPAGADFAVLVCLGNADVESGSDSVIVTAGRLIAYGDLGWFDRKASIIRERDEEFFSTWKLYTAKEVGATLWSIFGVVGIGAVAPDSRFARVGIRSGDILSRIDGTPIRSIQDATRLLCRAAVTWGSADLTLIRGERRREVVVLLQEW